jgi:alpha-glucosidase
MTTTGHTRFESIGELREVTRSGAGVDLQCRGGLVRIEVISDSVIRVRATWRDELAADESYAVVAAKRPKVAFKLTRTPAALTIATAALKLEIATKPLRLTFRDAAGRLLSADEGRRGMGFESAAIGREPGPVARFAMAPDEHFLGLGSKFGPLDRRGHAYTMWNTDAAPHVPNRDPIYSSFPVYMSLSAGSAAGQGGAPAQPPTGYARFFDNAGRSQFDFGVAEDDVFRYAAATGELNYYFIAGPTPTDILGRYADLTGRMPLPPQWALGHHQSRYSYFPQARVGEVARTIRQHHIPTDVIHIDIEYMDDYRVFTWDSECFPNPTALTKELHAAGFHTVTIVDPGVKNKLGYAVHDEGMDKNYFLRKADGRHFVGHVWPGASLFPDFTSPAVRKWWGDLHRGLLATGIDAIWNDMNEPALMGGGFGQSMDEDVIHDNGGHPKSHAELHNIYGMQMARATREGLQRLRPGERHFVLTRAAYPGAQRYTAIWLGDNSSWWEHLQSAMPKCLGMGMSGMPFVGVDIGGFFDDCQPELYARWVEMGAFLPFCRTHTCAGTRDQEPWSFGPGTLAIAKKYLGLRYRLMPYTYTMFHETAQTGLPIMRPLALAYPADAATYQVSDEYLWGQAFLVAPVYRENTTHRAVYLPAGKWVDYWTDAVHQGPAWLVAEAPLDVLPLYVRAGSIIPSGPDMEFFGQRPMNELTLDVYGGAAGDFTLYEDDGQSMAYEKGAWCNTALAYEESAGSARLTVNARAGRYKPAKRTIQARFHGQAAKPNRVTVNGKPAQFKCDPAAAIVTVQWPDAGKRVEVVVARP